MSHEEPAVNPHHPQWGTYVGKSSLPEKMNKQFSGLTKPLQLMREHVVAPEGPVRPSTPSMEMREGALHPRSLTLMPQFFPSTMRTGSPACVPLQGVRGTPACALSSLLSLSFGKQGRLSLHRRDAIDGMPNTQGDPGRNGKHKPP